MLERGFQFRNAWDKGKQHPANQFTTGKEEREKGKRRKREPGFPDFPVR
jgi:hypothetical protein